MRVLKPMKNHPSKGQNTSC